MKVFQKLCKKVFEKLNKECLLKTKEHSLKSLGTDAATGGVL